MRGIIQDFAPRGKSPISQKRKPARDVWAYGNWENGDGRSSDRFGMSGLVRRLRVLGREVISKPTSKT